MNLYFIAIIPPEHIREEIKYLKEEMRDKFGAAHALKLPAHITLVPPFKLKEERELQLMQELEIFAATRQPFHLNLSGFGYFEPRVIFVNVAEKKEIVALHDDIIKNLTSIPESSGKKDFHPHVTIATRDLEEALFPAARKYLSTKDYETRFEVKALTIFKHNGEEWEILMDFKFTKS